VIVNFCLCIIRKEVNCHVKLNRIKKARSAGADKEPIVFEGELKADIKTVPVASRYGAIFAK
jgi:hypothetical protein